MPFLTLHIHPRKITTQQLIDRLTDAVTVHSTKSNTKTKLAGKRSKRQMNREILGNTNMKNINFDPRRRRGQDIVAVPWEQT